MSLPRRLRNIAMSQIKAIRERLDRIDAEAAEQEAAQRRLERDARRELDDSTDLRPPLRSPEEIAGGPVRPSTPASQSANPLAIHYRVLGLEEGADLGAIEATYNQLAARCAPERFPEGSEEQQAAQEIFKRVDAAYNTLRDALDPTAGRFDKLEI